VIPEVEVHEVVDEVLLDVREADEFAWGRAPNSVHIPLYELPARLAELPPHRPLSVICKVGARSAQATMWLLAQGVEARNVRGGMVAWAAAGLPMDSDGPQPQVF
jgi:rhodanese-related sulfurtransferase